MVDAIDPTTSGPAVGVRIVAYGWAGGQAGDAHTGADGSWIIDGLVVDRYLVVAEVSARYRPRHGFDPWSGGDRWRRVLGLVTAGERPIDLVDLELVLR